MTGYKTLLRLTMRAETALALDSRFLYLTSPLPPAGPPAFCRYWHGVEHDPSKGFPHETAHRPRIRFRSGSRHRRLLLHPLLQLRLWFRRRLRPRWLRRAGQHPDHIELRPRLSHVCGLLKGRFALLQALSNRLDADGPAVDMVTLHTNQHQKCPGRPQRPGLSVCPK